MRLKVWTTGTLVFGIALLAVWPWLLGSRPPAGTPNVELARYGLRVLIYFGVTCLAFLTAAVLAWRLARVTREQYQAQLRANLDDLVEGTLRDHEQRNADARKS